MRGTTENQIKILSKKIVHSYFCENRLDFLFSVLAADVYYIGAGKNMQAEGRKKLQFFLTKAFSNLFPCAFFGEEGTLKAGESLYLDEMIGQAGNKTILSAFLEKTLDKTWFDSKQQAASDLCLQLTDCIDTSTADPIFDAYARYTYMDNVLRGGKPVSVGGKNLYVYSRKHGDLERDYNYFSMLPEYYSQGNGAYRDVNQNRRSDTFFTPAVGKTNIRNFFELIQIDGYNVAEIFVKHDSILDLTASGNAFVMVDVFDETILEIHAHDRAKVCVNRYGGEIRSECADEAQIKVREKHKKTY